MLRVSIKSTDDHSIIIIVILLGSKMSLSLRSSTPMLWKKYPLEETMMLQIQCVKQNDLTGQAIMMYDCRTVVQEILHFLMP